MSGASGRQRVDVEVIGNIEIEVPSLEVQRKIAAILSSYDDLIENNLRRIKILEEMARTIYREWFVKFRFPGHEKVRMVDSPLGKIPEGWEVKKLGEKIVFQKGRKPKEVFTKPNKGMIPHLLVNVLKGGEAEYCIKEGLVTVNEDDTLMVMDGSGSCDVFIGFSGVIGSTLGRFRSMDKKRLSPYTLYLFLSNRQDELKTKNIGAAVPHANREYINNIEIILPTVELNKKFEELVKPLFYFCSVLREKNRILRQTRDLLLPKLISGEIDVSELDIKIPDTERS